MQYCRSLKFEEKPDYTRLRKCLQDVAERMNYDHDYYYDWILKNSSMSKRMSKSNLPLPPKLKSENSIREKVVDAVPEKPRGISIDPVIRRDSYNAQTGFTNGSNSNNNTKYSYVNPISGLTSNEFNAISSRKDNPTA